MRVCLGGITNCEETIILRTTAKEPCLGMSFHGALRVAVVEDAPHGKAHVPEGEVKTLP